jgi:deoxyhypusine synthase
MGYNYSVRITTAVEYDGGLSGCTISESKSWGKYSLESQYITIWCDATIALPILICGLFQRLKII